ncbi:MAG TPA: UDP-N-acetylglucosamine 2-epimerase (non-hydrolyzing) [Anaerolineaceae bacterium]|nr:UDP-N-acetylglucosamine 2-epimerase (non-hydrolyzing) [Anaerolineaceae bacterium]
MKPIRVLSIFGTRPEAIKMAPVVKSLEQNPAIESRICVTAQHREMLDQVLELFNLHPDIDLDIMKPDQSLAALTADLFTHLDPVLLEEKPDWVLVQGDTTTVMAASLSAFYRGIRVGHVEAGLRTGDKFHPFPEEINRQITSVVADLHFAPTDFARANLLREGIPDGRIRVTGNTVIDALNYIIDKPTPPQVEQWLQNWGIGKEDRRLVLVTAHRRENFGAPIRQICQALRVLSEHFGREVQFIYPVHLNPNIQIPVHELLADLENVHLVDPLDYLSLIHLMRSATVVLTDSGGIQEEAAGLGKPTLVLREVTERPEGLQAGVLRLVGSDPQKIIDETTRLLEDEAAYARMAQTTNIFGDGKAAARIVDALVTFAEYPV